MRDHHSDGGMGPWGIIMPNGMPFREFEIRNERPSRVDRQGLASPMIGDSFGLLQFAIVGLEHWHKGACVTKSNLCCCICAECTRQNCHVDLTCPSDQNERFGCHFDRFLCLKRMLPLPPSPVDHLHGLEAVIETHLSFTTG